MKGLGMKPEQEGLVPVGNAGAEGMPPAGGDMDAGFSANSPDEDGMENASEEEQAQYDQFVSNGAKLIYSPEIRKTVQKNLSGAGNPIEGLANTLVMIVTRLDQSAQENSIEVSGDVKMHGAMELLDLLIEYAEESRIAQIDEKMAEQALYLAFDMYRAQLEASGGIDQASMEEDMQSVAAAEQAGQLDSLLPGMEKLKAEAGQGGGQPPPGQPEQEV